MSLENKVKKILENFEETSTQDIVDTLNQIKNQFQSSITQDYLNGKLQIILNTSDGDEKKKLCKNLKPYFDWFLQGN